MIKKHGFTTSLVSLGADIILIFIGILVYTKLPYFNIILSDKLISFLPVLTGCFIVCSLFHFLYDLITQKKYISTSYKAFCFLYYSINNFSKKHKNPTDYKYKYAFFLTLVKLIFVPIMIQFTINNFGAIVFIIEGLDESISQSSDLFLAFNNTVYPLLLSICFFVDTVVFLFAYLFYSEALGNTVRSVETSFLGWISALLCYPPLNVLTGYFLPAKYNDYVFFWSEETTFLIRILLLILLVIYTFSTLCLGWKSSNLTNRGIVSHGVYSWVRHPAYIAKNLFWWVTLIPVIPFYPMTIVYMAGISFIYYIRAITEERHLKKDPEYRSYCKKVKYRFIPNVI